MAPRLLGRAAVRNLLPCVLLLLACKAPPESPPSDGAVTVTVRDPSHPDFGLATDLGTASAPDLLSDDPATLGPDLATSDLAGSDLAARDLAAQDLAMRDLAAGPLAGIRDYSSHAPGTIT